MPNYEVNNQRFSLRELFPRELSRYLTFPGYERQVVNQSIEKCLTLLTANGCSLAEGLVRSK